MGESFTDPESSAHPPVEGRLDSWKEIAAYLKRDVTTVQRWEKREGMPVRRHLHHRLGTVYAFRADLDAWTRSRNLRVARDQENATLDHAAAGPSERAQQDAGGAVSLPVPLAGDVEATVRTPRRWTRWLMITTGTIAIGGAALGLVQRFDRTPRNPLAQARFEQLTDFDGIEQAAAISRDGRFVAFLSDRDGPMDVWLTQLGTGRFHNLTGGGFKALVNPSVRTLGFSPDGSHVTFWTRRGDGAGPGDIGIWAVPILGGQPRPYLEAAAESDWSPGARLVYHTPGPGDPMFVRDPGQESPGRQIFAAPAGLHSHFLLWAPNQAFIYFVQGSLPDALDIWRVKPSGGAAEQVTHHNSRVSYPVLWGERTLLYLADDPDGSGPWIHSVDVERREPQRITPGLDRYTSLAASADGRRLVATVTRPAGTLWRMPLTDQTNGSSAAPISLATGSASSPRLGPRYLLYVSTTGASDGIWKLADGRTTELWTAPGARVIGAPAIAPDGERIAFSIDRGGKTLLYVMDADGGNARVVTQALTLRGAPAWAPDGQSLMSAALDRDAPRLYLVSLDGAGPVRWLQEYSVDPVWDPGGQFVIYTGADVGTTFPVRAATTAGGGPHPLPDLTLTRGARHLRFLPGGRVLVMLRGEIDHKNLWLVDLDNGRERQLTNLGPDFNIRDFDVSPDGREIVLERVQERSDIVVIDVPAR
jgi:Tol biopolymer transport system component